MYEAITAILLGVVIGLIYWVYDALQDIKKALKEVEYKLNRLLRREVEE
jgi:hypothetical protein